MKKNNNINPEKIIKQIYEKKRSKKDLICIRFTTEELSVLQKMMEEEDWQNTSGFIKYKLFDGKTNNQYKQMKRSAKKQDIEILLKNLMEELTFLFGYVNYRYNYKLKKLHETKTDKSGEKHLSKLIAIMGDWKDDIKTRTESIYRDCEEILHFISIKTERKEIDEIQFIPDHIIEKASKDWTDTNSPEAKEAARRLYEEFEKKYNK